MVRTPLAGIWLLGFLIVAAQGANAQIVYLGDEVVRGTIESVSKGRIVIKDEDGKTLDVKIQPKDEDGVGLSGGALLRFPATVKVSGEYDVKSLEKGQEVRVEAELNRQGQTRGEVSAIWQVSSDDMSLGIEAAKEPEHTRDYVPCTVVGVFSGLVRGRLLLKTPPCEFTRETSLYFQLGQDAHVRFESDDYRRARSGARVEKAVLARMSTGDLLVKELEVLLGDMTAVDSRVDERLLLKYRHLSDEPRAPRDVRSEHFLLKTDISDRQARILIDKLETMFALLAAYFGRAPTDVIPGFVVRDLSQWPQGVLTDAGGIAKIRAGGGLCPGGSITLQGRVVAARAVVYACDDHGVVQHEATHAFCTMAFGSIGPMWLAEGLAEMSQYWKLGEAAVDIDPTVLQYIRECERRPTLAEITVPSRVPLDRWEDYAWRWTLCYLLANNPNYAESFRALAIALMSEQPNASFASVYGPVAKELSFEYELFLHSLDNGYDARLCAWQWGRKSAALRPGAWRKATVAARYGWQASGLKISDGERYDVAAAGEWRIAKDGARYSANGDANGRGRLIGVVLSDYRLSSPFDLGVASSFLAPADGDLYLRCQDDWWSLADNDGELTVSFRVTPRRAGERVPGGQALQGDDDKVGEVLLLDETDSKSDSPPLLPFAPQRGVQIVELLRLPPEDVRGKPRVELGLGGAEPKKFTPCKQVSGKEILGKFGLPDSVRTVTGKLALGAGGQQQEIKWQLWAYGNVMFFVDEADTTRYMCVDAVKPQQEEKAAEPKP